MPALELCPLLYYKPREECEKEKPKCGEADKESDPVSDHTHPFLITAIRLQASQQPLETVRLSVPVALLQEEEKMIRY